MPREKRRLKSPHPGVWVYKERWKVERAGADKRRAWSGFLYRGKWRDPDTGRRMKMTLKEAEYPTKESRLEPVLPTLRPAPEQHRAE